MGLEASLGGTLLVNQQRCGLVSLSGWNRAWDSDTRLRPVCVAELVGGCARHSGRNIPAIVLSIFFPVGQVKVQGRPGDCLVRSKGSQGNCLVPQVFKGHQCSG